MHITEPPKIIGPEHAFLHQKVKSKGLKDSSTCKSERLAVLLGAEIKVPHNNVIEIAREL